MKLNELYEILKETVRKTSKENDLFKPLPDQMDLNAKLEDIGLDPLLLPDIIHALKIRFGGKDLSQCLSLLNASHTLEDLLQSLSKALGHGIAHPTLVYVDDEDANLFIFKRKFDKIFHIKYFSDPALAREFILNDDSVVLVLTDEMMPHITGNELCDQVHALKPTLKFILLTGNPNNQEDLLYTSMRQNRFFEFLQKPIDFDNRFEELKQLFGSVLQNGK